MFIEAEVTMDVVLVMLAFPFCFFSSLVPSGLGMITLAISVSFSSS
jgi:hypothetical protein